MVSDCLVKYDIGNCNLGGIATQSGKCPESGQCDFMLSRRSIMWEFFRSFFFQFDYAVLPAFQWTLLCRLRCC